MEGIQLLTWATIVGLGVLCGRLAASRSRLRSDINMLLDAELAAGESPLTRALESCEWCGCGCASPVSVSLQTQDGYWQIALCRECLAENNEAEEQLAGRERKDRNG